MLIDGCVLILLDWVDSQTLHLQILQCFDVVDVVGFNNIDFDLLGLVLLPCGFVNPAVCSFSALLCNEMSRFQLRIVHGMLPLERSYYWKKDPFYGIQF